MPIWVAVKELKLSYHNPETIICYISRIWQLNLRSLTATQDVATERERRYNQGGSQGPRALDACAPTHIDL